MTKKNQHAQIVLTNSQREVLSTEPEVTKAAISTFASKILGTEEDKIIPGGVARLEGGVMVTHPDGEKTPVRLYSNVASAVIDGNPYEGQKLRTEAETAAAQAVMEVGIYAEKHGMLSLEDKFGRVEHGGRDYNGDPLSSLFATPINWPTLKSFKAAVLQTTGVNEALSPVERVYEI